MQPSQYRYTHLQYRFAVIFEALSNYRAVNITNVLKSNLFLYWMWFLCHGPTFFPESEDQKTYEFYITISHTQLLTLGVTLTRALLLDGNSEHVAHAWRKIDLFGEKNPVFDCSCSDALNRSNDKDCSLSAYLCYVSYHLI